MSNMDLYRFYDADDALLYVGISLHAAVRASEHRRAKPWWPFVARMEVEHLGEVTRVEAERHERSVILAERPRYNLAHNPDAAAVPSSSPFACRKCGRDVAVGFVVLRDFELHRRTPKCNMRRCSGLEGPLPTMADMANRKAQDPCIPILRPCYSAVWEEAHAFFSKLYAEGATDRWYAYHLDAKCEIPRRSREFPIDVEDARRIAAGDEPRPRYPYAPFRALNDGEQIPPPEDVHVLPFPPYVELDE
jgi:hypothetical protein